MQDNLLLQLLPYFLVLLHVLLHSRQDKGKVLKGVHPQVFQATSLPWLLPLGHAGSGHNFLAMDHSSVRYTNTVLRLVLLGGGMGQRE